MCDDLWDDNDATVICKQLGYSRGSARVSAYFGEGSGLMLLDDVNCNGRESSILDCNQRKFSEHDCKHQEDAGVVCAGESSNGMYMLGLLKNNELSCLFFTVRLVDGSSSNEGRVEVYYNGRWGTVCNDGWNDNYASLVCTQLGFGFSGSLADFGAGTGSILLDNVICSVTDTVLANCGHYGVGITVNCDHSKDVGVVCSGMQFSIHVYWLYVSYVL